MDGIAEVSNERREGILKATLEQFEDMICSQEYAAKICGVAGDTQGLEAAKKALEMTVKKREALKGLLDDLKKEK